MKNISAALAGLDDATLKEGVGCAVLAKGVVCTAVKNYAFVILPPDGCLEINLRCQANITFASQCPKLIRGAMSVILSQLNVASK